MGGDPFLSCLRLRRFHRRPARCGRRFDAGGRARHERAVPVRRHDVRERRGLHSPVLRRRASAVRSVRRRRRVPRGLRPDRHLLQLRQRLEQRLHAAPLHAAAAVLRADDPDLRLRSSTGLARLLRGMWMRSIALLLFSLLAACGGTIGDSDGGTDGGAQDSSPCSKCIDAPVTFACGDTFCSGSDAVCIHPCCGGAQICAPLEDGGACPSDLSPSPGCPAEEPCSNTCTPPPPYCATTAECSMPQGHDCYLLCQ